MKRVCLLVSVMTLMMVWTGCVFADAPAAPAAQADEMAIGRGKVVCLDYYFNHQVKNGKQFHYIWDDTKASGYSNFGKIWEQYGAKLASLPTEPTRKDLDQYSVYIIANPSTEKSAADHKPNYVTPEDAETIAGWVNDGGVLALFANDKNNCEFEHFDTLADKFGIHFNDDLRNTVPTHKDLERGMFHNLPDVPLFAGVSVIYMKEICTLTLTPPAEALLISDKQDGAVGKDVIIATAHYGKGFVFAVGDPWFYNEYLDGKPPELVVDNRKAAENLVKWLLGAATARENSPAN